MSWLTLSDGIRDSSDLLRALLTALQHTARERHDAAFHRDLAAVYECGTFRRGVAALRAISPAVPVIVVVDDFQKAPAQTDSELADIIEHGPPWLRLVVVTNAQIDPNLLRLHVHGRLATIGTAELALSVDEIRRTAHLIGRDIDATGCTAIHATTAGWPAAVRLTLNSDGDVPSLESDTEVMTEYIRTSVLNRMRPELADFVLSATVCTRMDERLAAVLSGRADAGRLIAECLSAGLFIERYEERSSSRAVYQWHSLFAGHCQVILRRHEPARWRNLNQRAARELADDDPIAAVEHAIRSRDASIARDIVAAYWLELLLQSRSAALDDLCGRLVGEFGEQSEILMIRACCRSLAGDSMGAALQFDAAGKLPDARAASRKSRFIGDLSCVLVSHDETEMAGAVERAKAVLADRTVVPARVYACALFVLGWAESRLRHGTDRGSALLSAAVKECSSMGLNEVATRARQNLALATAHAGDLDGAERLLRRGDAPSPGEPEAWPTHDGSGIDRFTAGWVNFFRGELDAARDDFAAVANSAGAGYPDLACLMLSFAAATLGDRMSLRTAEAAVARMADADTHGVPWSGYKKAAEARLAEMRGNPAVSLDLARLFAGQENVPMVAAVLSGMCRRLGDLKLARKFATDATAASVPDYLKASGLLTLALLDVELAPTDVTRGRLGKVLALAAPQRIRQPFLDNNDAICRQLLAEHLATSAYGGFVEDCLLRCERAASQPATPAAELTAREREVLALMRTPMTTADIAARLSVSVNTLKTHQRAIYRKLGVANRREAVGFD